VGFAWTNTSPNSPCGGVGEPIDRELALCALEERAPGVVGELARWSEPVLCQLMRPPVQNGGTVT